MLKDGNEVLDTGVVEYEIGEVFRQRGAEVRPLLLVLELDGRQQAARFGQRFGVQGFGDFALRGIEAEQVGRDAGMMGWTPPSFWRVLSVISL